VSGSVVSSPPGRPQTIIMHSWS